jgi:hypothetical protein
MTFFIAGAMEWKKFVVAMIQGKHGATLYILNPSLTWTKEGTSLGELFWVIILIHITMRISYGDVHFFKTCFSCFCSLYVYACIISLSSFSLQSVCGGEFFFLPYVVFFFEREKINTTGIKPKRNVYMIRGKLSFFYIISKNMFPLNFCGWM